MRILQVLPTLGVGGAEGFITSLCLHLSKDHDVRLLLLAGVRGKRGALLEQELTAAGVLITGAEQHSPYSLLNIFRMTSIIFKWQPDVVQANLRASEVVCCVSRFLTFPVRTKFCRRLANTSRFETNFDRAYKMLDPFFHFHIACSHAVSKYYKSSRNRNIVDNLVTIPNGIRQPCTLPTKESATAYRVELGLLPSDFIVVHIGKMTAERGGILSTSQKAHDILLSSFADAFGGIMDKKLVLVGDGPLRDELVTLACELSINEQVKFLGHQAEPWRALAIADVFCFPSRYEGLPNVILEATMAGVPIIASDIAEVRGIRPVGHNWALVEVDNIEGFSNALIEYYKSRKEKLDAARAVAGSIGKIFDMTKCAMDYSIAYRSFLLSE